MKTQKEYLKNYFLSNVGERIPIWKFVQLGIYRYGARIYELKSEGMNFQRREKVVKDPIFTKQRQVDYRYITKKFLKQEVKERLKIKEEERLKIKTIKENKISCNKISYTTEKDAIRAANYVRRKGRYFESNKKLTPYFCGNCGFYHLTSQKGKLKPKVKR